MRFALMSDIHLEFNNWTPPELDVDLVVLAGDTHPGVKGVIWANEHFKQPVLMIAGNHEFYGRRSVNRHPMKMQAKAQELGGKVQVLHNQTMTVEGIKFIGATLWTDYALLGNQPLSMMIAEQSMNDFRYASYDLYSKLRGYHLVQEHSKSRDFIESEIGENTVVITHHAPSEKCLQLNDRIVDNLSPAYASNLNSLVAYGGAKVWCFGHTHHNVDFTLGNTRVVSNCRGYEPGPYQPLIIEV